MGATKLIDILQGEEETDSKDSNELLKISITQTEIENILQSYTDFSDSFAELIQNSIDSLLTKIEKENDDYAPKLEVVIDQNEKTVEVKDNGIGIASEDFRKIFKPNFSLKKFKRYPHSRGHKGAATTYLQFAHSMYEIHAKKDTNNEHLSLTEGDKWIKDLAEYISDHENKSLPSGNCTLDNAVHPYLENKTSGCVVKVKFSKPEHIALFEAVLEDKDKAIDRLNHILFTRTAIGYVATTESDLSLPKDVRKISISVVINFEDSSTESGSPGIGHLYPHQIAKNLSKTISQFSKQSKNSDLIWKCWTHDNLKEAFFQNGGPLQNETEVYDIFKKFKITGYTSYAFENELYEKMIQTSLNLEPNSRSRRGTLLYDYLISSCTNAKWKMVAVDYPNGSLNPFEHRGGSEARSRLYCIWNFAEPFKPDYGRKSYPIEVKPFIIKMTKEMMLKMHSETAQNLRKNISNVQRGAINLAEARQRQNELRDKIKTDRSSSGPYLTGDKVNFTPSVATELEVQDYFCHLVREKVLKGYEIMQINNSGINDLLFNFHATQDEDFEWHDTDNPHGIQFSNPEVKLDELWMEMKVSITNLLHELDYEPDKDAKKWWELIDLVVVSSLDGTAGDRGYSIIPIDSSNIQHRIYFGATHLIQNSSGNTCNLIDLSEISKSLT